MNIDGPSDGMHISSLPMVGALYAFDFDAFDVTKMRTIQMSDYTWKVEPCPQPPSDTCHTGSQMEGQQGGTTPTAATSGDTPGSGTGEPTCG